MENVEYVKGGKWDLRREFSESMDKLDPLLTRIEKTDRLIDQIVYRLYGLNDKKMLAYARIYLST